MTAHRLSATAAPTSDWPAGWSLTVERAEDVEITTDPEDRSRLKVSFRTEGHTAESITIGPGEFDFQASRRLSMPYEFTMDARITLTVEPPESPGPDPLTQARGNLREIKEELEQVYALALEAHEAGSHVTPEALFELLGRPVKP